MAAFNEEPKRSILFLLLLQATRLVVQISLFKSGFISVSADEFSRGVRAAQWVLKPKFDLLFDVKDIWLPLEKYLNGITLMLFPDVIWAPRVTVFLASCLLIIAAFLAIYYLFENFWVAALAVIFISFQPWFVWLSGTPMLEMYYLAFLFVGLLFLALWLKEQRRGYWFFAGFCFLISSGFHVQSWVYINVINLLTLFVFIKKLEQKQYTFLFQMVGLYLLGNLLVITFTAVEYFDSGQLFRFLSLHTQYSKWFYEGYNVSVLHKLMYYPRLISYHSGLLFVPIVLVSLAFYIINKNFGWRWVPLTIALLSLFVNSLANVFSVPATAAPGRYSLFYMLLLSPYLGDAVVQSYQWTKKNPRRFISSAFTGIVVILLLSAIISGALRVPKFYNGMPLDSIHTGRVLFQLIHQTPQGKTENFLVELVFWDYLGVLSTTWSYDNLIFDREYDYLDRNKPSIFEQDENNVYSYLSEHHVQYIALSSNNLKKIVGQWNLIRFVQDVGNWSIFEFSPHLVEEN